MGDRRLLEDGSLRLLEDGTSLRLLAASNYRTAVLAMSPSLYWRLGESVGPTAYPEAGTLTGTYRDAGGESAGPTLGVASLLTGDSNSSMDCIDVAGNEVRFLDDPLLTPTSAISVVAWHKPAATAWDTASNRRVFQKGLDTQYEMMRDAGAGLGSSDFVFRVRATGTGTAHGPKPSVSSVHMLVGTYDGTTTRFYDCVGGGIIPGTPDTTASGNLVTGTGDAAIGNKPGSNAAGDSLSGPVDEVAIFPYALSLAQISTLYNVGRAVGDFPQYRNPMPPLIAQ